MARAGNACPGRGPVRAAQALRLSRGHQAGGREAEAGQWTCILRELPKCDVNATVGPGAPQRLGCHSTLKLYNLQNKVKIMAGLRDQQQAAEG